MSNKILFITLSNIGDVILTLPVLDYLRGEFPQAKVTLVCGERTECIFKDGPSIDKIIVYNKRSPAQEKIKLLRELKKENFDIIADMRNSFFGAILPARYKTAFLYSVPQEIKHMKARHLAKLRIANRKSQIADAKACSIYIKDQDKEYINKILEDNHISDRHKIIIISPGARSHIKRWPQDKFAELVSLLGQEAKTKIILAGDKEDVPISRYICERAKSPVIDLAGKTTISQLAALLKKASCVVTNDSAVLHLASYLDRPIVAIFGPTNDEKYGPWSRESMVVKKEIACRPCEKAQCRFKTMKCMALIKVEDLLRAVRDILVHSPSLDCARDKQSIVNSKKNNYRRILIVRTDRIGDVLLSTPVVRALREYYPCAYIAMMVSPYTREIVEGNPYLDEVIVYDKDGLHKSWAGSARFARRLKKIRFDLALILHPTTRVHLVTFFAGIPQRIGYNLKSGFLLNRKVKHTKQFGEMHEAEYNLKLLEQIGIKTQDKKLFFPVSQQSERYIEELFAREGITKSDKLLAIHPGASCPSKIWPNTRFAQVADQLAEKYGFKTLIVAGEKDLTLAQSVFKNMHTPAVNFAGRTSLSQLASLLKRCHLFISNDSGPVHIASSLGIPVVAIFGRAQKGLSPKRWGPLGPKDRVLHKEVGCIECLAHNCQKEFACLKAISVEDVVAAADEILQS